MDVTLYQSEPCPFSHRVRHQLSVHGVDYELVNVPRARDDRRELERITGQRSIPALVIDGEVHVTPESIGQAIADRWPAARADMAAIEQWGSPVLIVPLDDGEHTDPRAIEARLHDALAAVDGVELQQAMTQAPGVTRTWELVGSHVDDLVEAEPRLRALLPLRIVLVDHPRGASLQAPLPTRLAAPFRNLGLYSCAHDLEEQLADALAGIARPLHA